MSSADLRDLSFRIFIKAIFYQPVFYNLRKNECTVKHIFCAVLLPDHIRGILPLFHCVGGSDAFSRAEGGILLL